MELMKKNGPNLISIKEALFLKMFAYLVGTMGLRLNTGGKPPLPFLNSRKKHEDALYAPDKSHIYLHMVEKHPELEIIE